MDHKLDTGGGAYVGDSVATHGGSFIGRDQINIDASDTDGQVHIHFPPQSEPPPPPTPDIPPKTVGFLGREQELNYYRQQLQSTHVALITGMPGVGKTWLAAYLARQNAVLERTFWHRCLLDEGLQALIWAFAGFLATQNKVGLWQILHASRPNELPPYHVLLGYLFQELSRQNFLLCLDDVHHLIDDPGYERFVERTKQAVENGEFRLIITAQQTVEFTSYLPSPLTGLTVNEAQQLFARQNVQLDELLLSQLHERTEGNAHLLNLAAQALQHTNDPNGLIYGLVNNREIKNYLLKHVDKQLSDDERLVMQGVSALLEWPGTADEIEEVLDRQNERRTLTYLSNRYLLEEKQVENEIEYDAHAVIKSFYYETLSKRQRQAFHQRAAQYYAKEEPGTFKVALHYLKAGLYEQAANVATFETYKHLYSGHAKALLSLLQECAKQPLLDELKARVLLAMGDIYTFYQQLEPAQHAYQNALALLETIPISPTIQKFKVHAHRDLGFLYRSAQPIEAMKWLQAGLKILDGADPLQEADLQIQIGDIHLRLGEQEAAYAALEKALSLLPPTPSRLHLLALINLGRYHYYQNALTTCSDTFAQALHLAEQLQDPFNCLAMTVNVANLKQTTGDWAAAHKLYKQAEQLATELGDQEETANVALNWGVLFLHQGALDQATTQLSAAIDQGRKGKLHDLVILGLTYWAELQMMHSALEVARTALAEAKTLMTTHQIEFTAPFVDIMYARYFLLLTDYTNAQTYAERAIESARTQGMSQEEGQALRVLGEILLALHQYQAAIECCEKSLVLLDTISYEVAYSQVVTGQALFALRNVVQGMQCWRAALATFQRLGAGEDVTKVTDLIYGQWA